MNTTQVERFDTAYAALNARGAATKYVDVTESLGFDSSVDQITLSTSRDGHPREDNYRAIGWLMTHKIVDEYTVGKFTCLVNALVSPKGEISSIFGDRVDVFETRLGTGINYGHPLTERNVPNQAVGVESALMLIEQALESLPHPE